MKTKEELSCLKDEMEALNKKLAELTEEELKQVIGGEHCGIMVGPGSMIHAPTYGDVVSSGGIAPDATHSWFGSK